MKSRKRFMTILGFIALLGIGSSALTVSAEETAAGSLENVTAIAEILENGMTTTNICLEYSDEIASGTLKTTMFEIAGREIRGIYLNDSGELNDVQSQGKYAFLELAYVNTPWNDNRESWGTWIYNGEDVDYNPHCPVAPPREYACYMPIVIAGKQTAAFDTVDGKTIYPASFTNNEQKILKVDDMLAGETTDPDTGLNVKYRMFVPDGYNEKSDTLANVPLVLFLHGAGEGGDDNMSQVVCYRQAQEWITDEMQAEAPCFVLFPQCPAGYRWGKNIGTEEEPNYMSSEPADAMVKEMKSLMEQYNIDPKRVYVVGHSQGGQGAVGTAATYPDLFAGAIVGSSAMQPDDAGIAALKDVPMWMAVSEDERDVWREEISTVADRCSKNEPVAKIIGDEAWDSSVFGDEAVKLADAAVAKAKELGANKIYVEYRAGTTYPVPHHIHIPLFANKGIHDWLFSQVKK